MSTNWSAKGIEREVLARAGCYKVKVKRIKVKVDL